MIKSSNRIYSLVKPSGTGLRPIVIDSPHSGTQYPINSGIVAPANALSTTWDAYVDELWDTAPAVGAPLLAANFPRAYIDANRAPVDIDDSMLDGRWPHPLSPSASCRRGMGLIRLNALPGVPMYAGKLSVEEVQQRLRVYYQPYHDVLRDLLESAHAQFGSVWHINCHSMKSVGNAMNADNGSPRPDVVVSDCMGTSSDPVFTEWVASQFKALGYRTLINNPYQGGYIVKHYGMPAQGRHSVQIEINRAVYMNEKTFAKSDRFERLQLDISTFLLALASYVDEKRDSSSDTGRAA